MWNPALLVRSRTLINMPSGLLGIREVELSDLEIAMLCETFLHSPKDDNDFSLTSIDLHWIRERTGEIFTVTHGELTLYSFKAHP